MEPVYSVGDGFENSFVRFLSAGFITIQIDDRLRTTGARTK